MDFCYRAGMVALRNRNFIIPKLLPLTSDIQVLAEHLRTTMASQYDLLNRNPGDKTVYTELCKAVLAFLILFNQRRSGNTTKLKLATVQPWGIL